MTCIPYSRLSLTVSCVDAAMVDYVFNLCIFQSHVYALY